MKRQYCFRLATAKRLLTHGLGVILVWGMMGCDPTVEVLEPSDQYRYSLFGVLNVAADTQVIRVEPLGDTTRIGTPPDIEATVVLRNLDTGTEKTLRDSFAVVGGGIAQVHNFWTTYSIEPATSYQLAVQEEGETVTSATLTTPAQAPSLEFAPDTTMDRPFYLPCEFNTFGDPPESDNTFSLRAKDVETIAAADVLYPITYTTVEGTPFQRLQRFDKLNDVERREDGTFRIPVYYAPDLISLNNESRFCLSRGRFAQPHALVAVTAGGPDWPEWIDLPLSDIARPDTFTNVEGGHGYVGGVYSDTIKVPIRGR